MLDQILLIVHVLLCVQGGAKVDQLLDILVEEQLEQSTGSVEVVIAGYLKTVA